MLRLLGNPNVLCDGMTRRDLLHIGGLGAFGLALYDFGGLRRALATASYLLGIDPESTFPAADRRPWPITGTGHFRSALLG